MRDGVHWTIDADVWGKEKGCEVEIDLRPGHKRHMPRKQ